MSAPAYHLHPRSGVVYLGECDVPDPDDSAVPCVVLTASEEDVERAAIALAAAWKVDWDKLHGSSRDYCRVLVRGQIDALLASPVPPEPKDLSWRGVDVSGTEWARRSDGRFVSLGSLHAAASWADLWVERGPLREVK